MLRLALIFCFLPAIALAAPPPAGAEFRGYSMTNRIVRERLMKPGVPFDLGVYVGQSYHPVSINLLDLVGTYKSGTAGDRFKNGSPNSLNLLIWHLLLSGLSRDVGKLCEGERAQEFGEAFAARVTALCQWPLGASRSDAVLFDYWLAVMGYDAPWTEFEIWKRFAFGPEMAGLSGAEAVDSLTLSILNNPYFLLRH